MVQQAYLDRHHTAMLAGKRNTPVSYFPRNLLSSPCVSLRSWSFVKERVDAIATPEERFIVDDTTSSNKPGTKDCINLVPITVGIYAITYPERAAFVSYDPVSCIMQGYPRGKTVVEADIICVCFVRS